MQRTFERPEEAPIIYVGLPADYTGDIWHVICAMKAFSSLHVVITQTAATSYAKAVSQVEKQEKNAGLLKKQLVDAGIVQQRIEVITQKSEERVSETVIWDGNPMGILGLPGKADMWRSMALVQMAHPSAPVIPLYQTTRLFLAHCAHEARVGGGSVFEKLTIFLTDGLSGDEKASVLAAVEAHLNALPLDSNIMYVFCRNAGYNLQHNMTPDRWGKIVAGVQQAKTWVVCGVGNKQDELIKSILSPEQQEQMLDFYAQPTNQTGWRDTFKCELQGLFLVFFKRKSP